ncbi:MAG: hypothetical protein ACOYN3_08040 [Acidimicrobiia bacterium]
MISYGNDHNWILNAGLDPSPETLTKLQSFTNREPYEPINARSAFRNAVWGVHANPALDLSDRAIANVLTHLRTLAAYRLNAVGIIGAHPPVVRVPPEALSARIENLAKLGFSIGALIPRAPEVLCRTPVMIQAQLDALRTAGFDPVPMIERCPALLALELDTAHANLALFAHYDISTVVACTKHPEALLPSTKEHAMRFALLDHTGGLAAARAEWNRGNNLAVLSAPIETQLLMAGITPEDFVRTPERAEVMARDFGFRTRDDLRRNLLARIVDVSARYSDTFTANLGPVAAQYLEYSRTIQHPVPTSGLLYR